MSAPEQPAEPEGMIPMSVATTLTAQDVVDAFFARVSDKLDDMDNVAHAWSSPARSFAYERMLDGLSCRVDSERCVVVETPDSGVDGWNATAADILDMVLVDLDTDGSLFNSDGELTQLAPRIYCYAW